MLRPNTSQRMLAFINKSQGNHCVVEQIRPMIVGQPMSDLKVLTSTPK